MQLLQFVAILVQAVLGYLGGAEASYPDWVKIVLLVRPSMARLRRAAHSLHSWSQ